MPTNCIEQGFLLCEAVVKAMLLLENCDYGNSRESLEEINEQLYHRIHDNNDKYSEAYENVVKLLNRLTEEQNG